MDLSHLNPPQREAVTHGSGPLLVLAGAGSGKTRVIIHRIAHILRRGIPPRAVAALTFTNKAAEEMRERIGHLLGDSKQASELTMGTFHSLGLRILKQERKALGFPRGFVIYDTSDQLGVLRELLRRIRIHDRRFDVKAILTRISLAKNAFVSPEDYKPVEGDEYDEITSQIYPKYQRALRSFAAVDFDDLIVEPVRLFQNDEAVASKWREMFAHVLVDEFQDTNRAQLLMVQHLVENHSNLCVVGDDDQSIYAWRGADPRNILGFDRIYPQTVTVKLEQNYRSTPNILDAANAVIKNNTARHGKTLWSDKQPGATIISAVAPDVGTEAQFVSGEILRLVDSDECRYKDCAILYRSNNQTQVIEEELRTREVPYVMYGGQQFFERKEVKDIIAYLRFALNDRDEISLRRILNYPARGIGATTVERLTAASHKRRTSMWKMILKADQLEDDIRTPSRRGLYSFVELIDELRASLDSPEGVVSAVHKLIDRIDLYGDIRSGSPSLTAAQRRIDNVKALIRSLERHQARNKGKPELAEYLRHLSLNSNDEEDSDSGNRVIMTTLHGAKGLEFPVVFLIGLEEEILPHARTLMPHATDVNDPDHVSDVSEERRLAYVGITRAKDKLYMTRVLYRKARGKKLELRTPSRFLLEIPEELVEERDVAAEAREPVAEEEVKSFFANFDFD